MTIEEFNGDLNVLLNIFNDARKSAEGLPDKEASLQEFKKYIEGEKIYTAKSDGNIVGFVSVWGDCNFIHHLYVDPLYQGRKIGSSLVAKCKEIFSLPLLLKCVEKNQRACSFYEDNGWAIKEKGVGPEGTYILYILMNDQKIE